MDSQSKKLGVANRIRVRMPISGYRHAWDCRPFGLGRVIAPVTSGAIEVAPRVHLDLATGELRAEISSQKRSA